MMKEYAKLLAGELAVVLICAAVGTMLLTAVYLIPHKYMYDNVKESSAVLHNEGEYSEIWETIRETRLDGYTDGLILNVAYTEVGDSRRDILLNPTVRVGGGEPYGFIV